jgi:Lrp/AsnC family leucine-responsive transcriptional regulator
VNSGLEHDLHVAVVGGRFSIARNTSGHIADTLKPMTMNQPELDTIDCNLLAELQANARISFAELGRKVSLSTPTVIERVKRLEEGGVIIGYHAQVNPSAVGRSVEAFIKVSVAGDKLMKFAQTVKKIEEVLECYRITGAESFLVLVAVRDTAHLQAVIDQMMPYVATNTSIILDVPVRWNPVVPEVRQVNRQRSR